MPTRMMQDFLQGTRTGRIRFMDTEAEPMFHSYAAETDFATIERRLIDMAHTLEMNNLQIDPDFLSKLGGGIGIYQGTPKPAPEAPALYNFDDLSEEAKNRVRRWYVEAYGVNEDSIQNEFTNVLNELGYPVNGIRYELKFTQSDVGTNGMAFYGDINEWKVCKIARRLLTPRKAYYIRKLMVAGANIGIYIGSRGYGRKAHDINQVNVSVDFDQYKSKNSYKLEKIRSLLNEFKQAIEDEMLFVSKMLTMKGVRMYNELKASGAMDEALRNEGYQYLADGERFKRRSRHDSHAIYRGESSLKAMAGGFF
jgi:hypothetical protein